MEEPPPLVGREPIAQAHAEAADAFHPTNPAANSGLSNRIGGLIGDP